jgi:hypothetical protein
LLLVLAALRTLPVDDDDNPNFALSRTLMLEVHRALASLTVQLLAALHLTLRAVHRA